MPNELSEMLRMLPPGAQLVVAATCGISMAVIILLRHAKKPPERDMRADIWEIEQDAQLNNRIDDLIAKMSDLSRKTDALNSQVSRMVEVNGKTMDRLTWLIEGAMVVQPKGKGAAHVQFPRTKDPEG